jgi:hypothetical protein
MDYELHSGLAGDLLGLVDSLSLGVEHRGNLFAALALDGPPLAVRDHMLVSAGHKTSSSEETLPLAGTPEPIIRDRDPHIAKDGLFDSIAFQRPRNQEER